MSGVAPGESTSFQSWTLLNSGVFDWGAVGSATAPKMAVPVGLSSAGAAPPVPTAAAAGIGGTGGTGADVGMGGAAGKRLAPDCGAAGIAGIAGIGGLRVLVGAASAVGWNMPPVGHRVGHRRLHRHPARNRRRRERPVLGGPQRSECIHWSLGACLRLLATHWFQFEGEAALGGMRWCAARRATNAAQRLRLPLQFQVSCLLASSAPHVLVAGPAGRPDASCRTVH